MADHKGRSKWFGSDMEAKSFGGRKQSSFDKKYKRRKEKLDKNYE